MTENDILQCKSVAKNIRKRIITMTHEAGTIGAHIGGALSLVEIMAVLYTSFANVSRENVLSDERNRVILSKGHGVMAQYAALSTVNVINENELKSFKKDITSLYAHPSINKNKGIEFSSGSLGQGLSLGVGVGLALKINKSKSKIYVIIGDGECNEGMIWEAAMSASHFKLNNIIVIIDRNGIQYDGKTEDIMSIYSLKDKWESFGWDVVEIDGHSVEELYCAFEKEKMNPTVIIANTVKGKGVSFMENQVKWHNGRLSDKMFEEAMKEQEDC